MLLTSLQALQELSRLYSEQHVRDAAARIKIEAKSGAKKWLEDARAVPMGDEYELFRCGIYRGRQQRFNDLWCFSAVAAAASSNFRRQVRQAVSEG